MSPPILHLPVPTPLASSVSSSSSSRRSLPASSIRNRLVKRAGTGSGVIQVYNNNNVVLTQPFVTDNCISIQPPSGWTQLIVRPSTGDDYTDSTRIEFFLTGGCLLSSLSGTVNGPTAYPSNVKTLGLLDLTGLLSLNIMVLFPADYETQTTTTVASTDPGQTTTAGDPSASTSTLSGQQTTSSVYTPPPLASSMVGGTWVVYPATTTTSNNAQPNTTSGTNGGSTIIACNGTSNCNNNTGAGNPADDSSKNKVPTTLIAVGVIIALLVLSMSIVFYVYSKFYRRRREQAAPIRLASSASSAVTFYSSPNPDDYELENEQLQMFIHANNNMSQLSQGSPGSMSDSLFADSRRSSTASSRVWSESRELRVPATAARGRPGTIASTHFSMHSRPIGG